MTVSSIAWALAPPSTCISWYLAPPISMSISKAARSFIKQGTVVTEGLLNRVEMAFRAYDPCFGCATHSLPGQMPLTVRVRDVNGTVLSERRRD